MRLSRLLFGLAAFAAISVGAVAFAVHVQPEPAALTVASLPDLVTAPVALFVVNALSFALVAFVAASIVVEIVRRVRGLFARRAEPDDGFGLDDAWRVPDPPG